MRLLLIAAALWRGGGAKESRTLTLERHRRDRHHPTKQAACTNTCPACLNTKHPRLYSLLHVDGVGTTVKYVLEHARFARDHGYAYGGAVGALPATPQAHGVENLTIKSKDRKVVKTGLAVRIPIDSYARIAPSAAAARR